MNDERLGVRRIEEREEVVARWRTEGELLDLPWGFKGFRGLPCYSNRARSFRTVGTRKPGGPGITFAHSRA